LSLSSLSEKKKKKYFLFTNPCTPFPFHFNISFPSDQYPRGNSTIILTSFIYRLTRVVRNIKRNPFVTKLTNEGTNKHQPKNDITNL